MKKMIILATIMMVALTGCGSKEETVKETENTFFKSIDVKEIEVVETVLTETVLTEEALSEEYLTELEYNSKSNVYFGEEP